MNRRTTATALSAVLSLSPLAAVAQSGVYVEPAITQLGKAASAAPSKGTVVVQVYVHKDGSAKVQRIIRSSAPDDNKAAMEIAAASSYKAATRGGSATDAFKDFTLNFVGGTATVQGGSEGGGGSQASMESLLRAGKYAEAKAAATTFVSAHPGDQSGYAVLGAADAFLGDAAGGASAFDKAGTVSERFKPLAAQSYLSYSTALSNDKKFDQAIAYAKKGLALTPTATAYNAVGVAELGSGDYASATREFEQANKLIASDPKATSAQKAQVLANLSAAYAGAGNVTAARTAAAAAQKLDPQSTANEQIGGAVLAQAQQADKDKKFAEAASLYEQAAQLSPSHGTVLYTRAAFAFLNLQPKPDTAKAEADAQKALALAPNDAGANFAMGVALANEGKKQPATDALNKALASAKAENQTAMQDNIEQVLKQLSGAK